ncbi:putative transferase CAF17 homolog, mitochondrial [Ostrinia nubilalis]|uniref:putative transferase CAF17 homolog, mitochondrial n=1 Tax=Ostrinia nubilalis TaxID=29057 RepID=UPI003082287C
MISYRQVNLLLKRNVVYQLLRHSHSDLPSARLFPLKNRKLLKIQGNDAPVFLQGLITNDMRHFEEGSKSMYAMFLNNKGRVLYDTLIHKWEGAESFLIECDEEVLPMLQKHLKIFKLKRKVDIEDINQKLRLWALITKSDDVIDTNINSESNINVYKDPRLADLGFRVLSTTDMDGAQIAGKLSKDIAVENTDTEYQYLRYKLGVSEGSTDLPPGTCFPLEVNCDYLHGVSFHKGCYIGQELTARVHHTGVVRKRIMPLKFSQKVENDLTKDSIVSSSSNPKSNLGKLRGFVHDYGIGLVRIKEVLDAKTLNIGKYTAEVFKPSWWPIEAPREKVATKVEQE